MNEWIRTNEIYLNTDSPNRGAMLDDFVNILLHNGHGVILTPIEPQGVKIIVLQKRTVDVE